MDTVLKVKLKPGGRKDEILGLREDGVLLVEVKEPPVKGRANKALIKLLSKKSGVDKTNIEIKSGLTSRDKTLVFRGIDRDTLISKLVE